MCTIYRAFSHDVPFFAANVEKISCVGIDPVLIPAKTYNPECLLPVKSEDLVWFLVLVVVFEETRRRCQRINPHFNHVHELM